MISLVKLLRAGASPVNPQVNPGWKDLPDRELLSLPSPSRCGHRWTWNVQPFLEGNSCNRSFETLNSRG